MGSRGSNCKPNSLSFGDTVRASCKKQPKWWKNKWWILHQENTPALNAQSVKRYLVTEDTPVLEYARTRLT